MYYMIYLHQCTVSGKLTKLIVLFPAIATVVTVAEILKNNGFAVEKSKNFISNLPVWTFT